MEETTKQKITEQTEEETATTAKPQSDKRKILLLTATTAFVIGSLLHYMTWNNYFFAVLPLQFSVFTKTASAQDHFDFAKICVENNLPHCALQNFRDAYRMDPQLPQALLEAGVLEMKVGDFNSSVESLIEYLSLDNTSTKAKFNLALAYRGQGKLEESIQTFEELLDSDRTIIQWTTLKEYIPTLISAKKWSLAKRTIDRARRQSIANKNFMTGEYAQILNALKESSNTSERSVANE